MKVIEKIPGTGETRHIYDACAAGVTVSRSVAGPIEREVAISRAAGVKAWASEDEIRRYTTWQVQQMRRVMRCLRAQPWRDNQMMADEIDRITWDELRSRGAVGDRCALGG